MEPTEPELRGTPPRDAAAGRRIGVFGGTFDPPHVGHLVSASDVRERLGLDVVLLVVANEPWQKVGTRPVTPAPDRLAMVRAAVDGVPGLEASDLELRRGGTTYTIDTVHELRRLEPTAELSIVIGSDAAAALDTWERADELARSCRFVVVERPGSTTSVPVGFEVEHLQVPRLEVSSTDLRERARTGRSLRFLVPDPVVSLIESGRLYGDPQ